MAYDEGDGPLYGSVVSLTRGIGMSEPQPRMTKADAEAAAWHTQLGNRSVTTTEIEEFYDWRRDPANTEAYRKVETLWAKAKTLDGRPSIQGAVAEALARKRAPSRRTVWVGAIAATAGVVLAVGGTVWLQGRNHYVTAIGEERVVQLADGSSVRLDTGSSIKVMFSGSDRRVELETGRAMFTVAHDAARPFLVRSGDTQVRAVGTVFDVMRDGGTVTVSMVEGLVDVTGASIPAAEPQRLAAGQQVRLSARGRQTQTINVADTTSWAQGRLVFRDKPLADAVGEVNRYLTQKIVLAPSAPGDVPVSGVFLTGDRDAFVSAASELFQLTATTETDGSIRLSADKK